VRATVSSRSTARSPRSLRVPSMRLQCPACGQTTLAALPGDVAGQFGPQPTALIAYLTVVWRLPRLVVQRFLEGALQIPISLPLTAVLGDVRRDRR
jgi:hypothetical protein